MGSLLMTIALTVPVAAGVLLWSWWVIPVCGIAIFFGFYLSNPSTVERLHTRAGLLLVAGAAIAANMAVCTLLFGLGRLLSLI